MKFEHVSIYNGIGFKKKLKAPTEHCFVLKVCLRFYCVAWLSLALSLKEIQYRFADRLFQCLLGQFHSGDESNLRFHQFFLISLHHWS